MVALHQNSFAQEENVQKMITCALLFILALTELSFALIYHAQQVQNNVLLLFVNKDNSIVGTVDALMTNQNAQQDQHAQLIIQ